VFGYANISTTAQAQVETAVNASGSRVFVAHNSPVPSEWPEAVSAITTDLLPVFQKALEQHDKDLEKKEKSLRNRLIRIGIGLLWTVGGILLGWILLGWIASLSH
jgi:hypothetical protein